jgi:hypothetical protein
MAVYIGKKERLNHQDTQRTKNNENQKIESELFGPKNVILGDLVANGCG